MNSHKKPRSLQDIIKNRQQSVFVGREEQLNLFQRNLSLGIDDDRRYFLFNVWGQGGVGKTSLINRYQKMAEDSGAITGRIDEDERDVPSVMGRFAKQFEQQGNPLRRFIERYKVYRQKREELETDPEMPQGFAGIAGRTIAKGTLKLAEQVPVVGTVLDLIDQDVLATQVGEWTAYIARKIGNKDEVKLVLQPEEVLTPLFLEDLNEVANKRLVCLFFDTYEQTGNFLNDWLINVLSGDYNEVSPNIAITIAGRNKLDRNQWTQYEGLIAHLPLESFTEDEAKDYLTRKGITNQKVIDIILELSGRLPLLVATLAAGKPDDPEALSDACDTAVDRFLKWVDDSKKRQIALNAALLRRINRDILSGLVGQEDADALFSWLKEMPFVQKRTEGWVYHSVVRSQMLRYKRRESSQNWAELHGLFVEFYKRLREDLDLDTDKAKSDPTWQDYTLEMVYHSLSQSPRQRLNESLSTLLEAWKTKRSLAQRFAETIQQVGQEVEVAEIERWGEQLAHHLRVDHESRYTADVAICSDLIKICPNDDWLLRKRGSAYRNLEHYEEAISDFTRAIELNPQFEKTFTGRGLAYFLMRYCEEAISDFTRAIELSPQSEAVFGIRGITYRQMERYEEAISDLTRAIELNPQSEMAFENRGIAYRQMERYEEAISDFTRAIELNPQSETAFENRGDTYRLIRRYEEAIADFIQDTRLDPNATCLDGWGLVLSYQGYYAEALEIYSKDLEKNPNSFATLYNIAVVSVRWRGVPIAQTAINNAYQELTSVLNTEAHGAALYGLGGIAALLGNVEKALNYLEQAIPLERNAVIWARQDIAWNDLRDNLRFQKLITSQSYKRK